MPDTVVDVQDDDLGVYGPMYVEAVALEGQGNRTISVLSLLRLEDVFFQSEVESSKKATGAKLKPVGINANVFIPGIATTPNLYGPAPGLDKNWKHPASGDALANLPEAPSREPTRNQIYTRKGK
jgi:hypothetical protein